MDIHRKRTTCILCGGGPLVKRVEFAHVPIAGDLVSPDAAGEPDPLFPVDLYQCGDCGEVQLIDVIDPNVLFRGCTYSSGQTGLARHFKALADAVVAKYGFGNGDFVVDIGSNDGAYLQCYAAHGLKVLGVDPSIPLAEKANRIGIETIAELFDSPLAQQIKSNHRSANLVTANNVFAHSEALYDIALGVAELLTDDGLFIFEVSYVVDVLDKLLLGTIFHEHLCYHSVTALERFMRRAGLELVDVERAPIQGGSLIGTAQRQGGVRSPAPCIQDLIADEHRLGLFDAPIFTAFSQRKSDLGQAIDRLMRERLAGGVAAGFGAARGGPLYLYEFGLYDKLAFVVDDDPAKQGLLTPGSRIPVVSSARLYETMPTLTFVLAWVHSEKIVAAHRRYLEQGGTFVVFYPEFRVYDASHLPSQT